MTRSGARRLGRERSAAGRGDRPASVGEGLEFVRLERVRSRFVTSAPAANDQAVLTYGDVKAGERART